MILIAKPTITNGATTGVSIKPILPDDYQNKDVSYFDLTLEKGQEITLDLELTNTTNQEGQVGLTLNPATTNDNGLIDYSQPFNAERMDDSLKLPIDQFAELSETTARIPANSSKIVKIKVKLPDTGLEGTVLGGIYATVLSEENQETNQGSSMAIKNKIVYTTGLKISENRENINGDLLLKKVVAGQISARNMVLVNLQNPIPALMEKLVMKASVTKKGSDKLIQKKQTSGYKMAPNSNFNYAIDWNNQPFVAGDYLLKMEASSESTGQNWAWTKEFTITSKEAKELNEKAVDLDRDNTWMYLWIGLFLLLLLVGVLISILLIKQKNREKLAKRQEQKKQQRRTKKSKGNKKKSERS